MALDGIFLRGIVTELQNSIINGKVDKVNQPEDDEIIIFIRNNSKNIKLLISSSPVYPKIHITDINKENPIKAPMFCMVLRKYLKGGKILKAEQIGSDRIIKITFSNTDELGFDSIYNLYVEIMGRHSNITLVRERDNMIMDSIKHITPDINRVRTLLPKLSFVFPPESVKLDPYNSSPEEINSFIKDNNIAEDSSIFSNCFTGVSTPLSKELYIRYKDNFSGILNFFKNLDKEQSFYLYEKLGKFKDFSPISLSFMDAYKEIIYESPSKLLQDFYFNKDKNDRLNSKSSNLQKIVNTNIDRCEKKIKILKDNLEKAKDKDSYKLRGELLTANIYAIKEGMSKIKLCNYYSDNEEIEINLNPQKSPSHNIQDYYKKYNKLKITEKMSQIQLGLSNDELLYLNSVMTNILNCDTYKEIDDIRKELIETGYIRFRGKKGKETPSKPMHFKSSEGIDIYVGKNNIQNDYLTLKLADKGDTWLHTKDIPGSHVIIKSREISETLLSEAASLAAYYSKGRTSSKVPVDYTQVKNVKKPNGAKPGMVIYSTNNTIYVTPPQVINLERVG
jgi:predicted ribosome quality control (RQC) complex YloA/Tae2 family protein